MAAVDAGGEPYEAWAHGDWQTKQREDEDLELVLRYVESAPLIVSFPLEVVEMDFFVIRKDVYQNILVTTDMFIHYAWAIPTRDQTARTTARASHSRTGKERVLHRNVLKPCINTRSPHNTP